MPLSKRAKRSIQMRSQSNCSLFLLERICFFVDGAANVFHMAVAPFTKIDAQVSDWLSVRNRVMIHT